MPYSAAIFDLDGPLLDTLGDLHAAVNHALGSCGLPARSAADVRAFTGDGLRKLAWRSAGEGVDEGRREAVYQELASYYADHCQELTRPYPGVPEVVDELRGDGVRCGVVSNKVDSAVRELVERFFPGQFDFVVGEREAEGIRKKPAPDTVEACLTAFGVAAADAVYVGDSEVDVETARNAGCDCIIVTWGFRDERFLREHGARTLAHTAGELAREVLA